MSGHRVSAQPTYLIHTRAYRETSLIIEAFSRDYGKVSLIAKGVRKKKSRSAAYLQPFTLLTLSWQGRSELQTLTTVDCPEDSGRLQGKSLYCGFYLNELLILLLTKHDPHPALFSYYSASLKMLKEGVTLEAVLRFFELRLLDELGYGLNLESECNTGQPIIAEQRYHYHPEEGATLAAKGSKGTFHGRTLIDLSRYTLDSPQSLLEAKKLMRSAIELRLDGRLLKSRSLFKNTTIKVKKQRDEKSDSFRG